MKEPKKKVANQCDVWPPMMNDLLIITITIAINIVTDNNTCCRLSNLNIDHLPIHSYNANGTLSTTKILVSCTQPHSFHMNSVNECCYILIHFEFKTDSFNILFLSLVYCFSFLPVLFNTMPFY